MVYEALAMMIVEVSLFTREWIEIWSFDSAYVLGASPSLRGSGLKFTKNGEVITDFSLPLYEGVD